MIDRAMIKRLLEQIGTPDETVTENGMEFARAIYMAGMEEERDMCAKICDLGAEMLEAMNENEGSRAALSCAASIRMRSNCEVTGAAPEKGER